MEIIGILSLIVIAMVQLLKQSGINKKIIPFSALIFGILLSIGAFGFSFEAVIEGLIIGFSACGMWSGVKSVIK